MTTPNPTPSSPSTGFDAQKSLSDLQNMLKQAAPAQKQGTAPASKSGSK